jgi:hypothetical protein
MSPLLLAFLLAPANRQEITQAQLAMRTMATADSSPSSPLLTIRAINEVVALGPKQAKTVMDDYFRGTNSDEKSGLYPFIRCIFDIPKPPGYLPTPALGPLQPFPPGDLRKSPRYPIALVGGIPYWIASGGAFAGHAESEAIHFRRLEQIAPFRTTPLIPIDKPWRILVEPKIPYDIPYDGRRSALNQDILGLVHSAYRPRGYVDGENSSLTDTPQGWRSVVAEMERTGMRWDRVHQQYVRADGSILPGK